MRRNRFLNLLPSFALLGALIAVGGADDAKPGDDKPAIPLPASVLRGVVSGDHFYAVADGRLVDVDLMRQKAKTFDELDAKLTPYLDVNDGKACIASDGRLYLVDLADGKTVRSAEFRGDVRGLGILDANRVFVFDGLSVAVVDLAAGKTVQTIEVAKSDSDGKRRIHAGMSGAPAFQHVGNRLYVVDSSQVYDSRLSVIDLDGGKVLDQVGLMFWCGGIQVIGDKAFVRGVNLSYGINSPQFAWFDLKTKKVAAFKFGDPKDRVPNEALDQQTLFAGPDDCVCLGWGDQILQYDAQGRQVGKTPLAKETGRLVGVWNGQALTAGKDALRLTPLGKGTAKGD